jgi:hypothetical protein
LESGKFRFCWVILGEAVPISVELERVAHLIQILKENNILEITKFKPGPLNFRFAHPLGTERVAQLTQT